MGKDIQKSVQNEEFYTVEETAGFLQVTVQSVTKYLRTGELEGEKRGPKKKWHVNGASIKAKMKAWNMLKQ